MSHSHNHGQSSHEGAGSSSVTFAEPPVSDTPPDMPGTPTSTTTSISALSTVAIKDGQRGHFYPSHPLLGRGHHHNPSTTSLEAERADRISRLAGLERISTLRASPTSAGSPSGAAGDGDSSLQTTSTSQGFPALINGMPVVYFDAQGQPQARTKINTTGAASATTASTRASSSGDTRTVDERSTASGETTQEGDVGSIGAGVTLTATGVVVDLDESMSVGGRSMGFDDRMSDDGASSLVGFGEGAGSTISGPIYTQRRGLRELAGGVWGVGRDGPSGEREDGGGGLESPRFGVLHQRVDSSNSLGEMSSRSGGGAGPGTGAGNSGQGQSYGQGQTGLSHARVMEWAQQPAATRRFKTSREAAESIMRERRLRGES